MKFRTQIIAFGLASVLLLALTGGIGVVSTSQLAVAIGESTQASQALAASSSADMMHDALRGDAQLAAIGAMTKTPERVQDADKDFQEHAKTLRAAFASLKSLPLAAESRAALAGAEPLVTKYIDIVGKSIGASKTDAAAAEKQLAEVQVAFADLEPRLAALSDSIGKTGEQTSADVTRGVSRSRMAIAVTLALAALAVTVLAWNIARAMLRQLGGEPLDAAALAQKVAGGDLTATIRLRQGDTTSLMAQLKTMQESIAGVVTHVRENADGVATASVQIAQGNNDLSSRTEQQASALEETAASMEELSGTVKRNADHARQGNQLAQNASAVAVQGGEVVGRVVDTMKGINDSSRKIADIIGVIDGIAFQTNILALNAAVEAARAGEQGRGFAVVASEVRSLAGRSAQAAKEIKALIADSVQRAEQGTTLADQAGATMSEVVGAIRRVTDIMGEISAATTEQSTGVAQVGEAVAQMDQATQQNAALVEQSAAAAEGLKVQARQLVEAIAIFRMASPTGRAISAGQLAANEPTTTAPLALQTARPQPRIQAPRPAPRETLPPPLETRRTGTDDDWTTF